jgi:hypothetical protein
MRAGALVPERFIGSYTSQFLKFFNREVVAFDSCFEFFKRNRCEVQALCDASAAHAQRESFVSHTHFPGDWIARLRTLLLRASTRTFPAEFHSFTFASAPSIASMILLTAVVWRLLSTHSGETLYFPVLLCSYQSPHPFMRPAA